MARKPYHNKKSTFKLNNIETKILNVLKSLDVKYVPNAKIDRYSVDFLVEGKFIIECYGDFWHCNPQIYSPDFFNKGKKKLAKDIWERDNCRKNKFQELGYKFLSLWESEINSNPKNIRKKIKNLLRLSKEE